MYIVKPIEGSSFESYRENTNYLLEMLDDGIVDGDSLARELLQYLSDDEVGPTQCPNIAAFVLFVPGMYPRSAHWIACKIVDLPLPLAPVKNTFRSRSYSLLIPCNPWILICLRIILSPPIYITI